MKSHAEHLPPEIWMCIFDFLEGHDIIRSFTHLNSFFDSLLRSPQMQFYIRIKENEFNERLPESTWSHIGLQNVGSLFVGRRKGNCLIQFLRWHAPYLVCLRSLFIYLRKSKIHINIQFLIIALTQMSSLKCIRVKYFGKSDQNVHNLQALTTYIFSGRSTIQNCSFITNMSDNNMTASKLSVNRLLKHLEISSISSISLFSLLPFTPALSSLKATLDPSHGVLQENLILNHFTKAHIRIDRSQFSQLELFKKLAPNLQSLRLEGCFDIQDDKYFNETLWHKLLDNIEHFNIYLREFAYLEAQKTPLTDCIRNYNGKYWFDWEENGQLLSVYIKFIKRIKR